MVISLKVQESHTPDSNSAPKFYPDGFMSEVLTNGEQTGVWLYLIGRNPDLRWIPEDTINHELDTLDLQEIDVLFAGVDYIKRE